MHLVKGSEEVNFEVKSTIVEELGRNLYSADNSIIVELIANAYDADSTKVKIKFDPLNDEITITDNGAGMNFDTVRRDFLTVGDKNRLSKTIGETRKFRRRRLGRKGIGRLSFFALGSIVAVETTNLGEKLTFSLHYEKLLEGNEVISIDRIVSNNLNKFPDGTTIRISKLQDGIKKGTFLKQMVVGIGHVFNDLLKDDADDSFAILISSTQDSLIKDMVANQEYAIKKVFPDFSKTLIFYSLDSESDKILAEVKKSNAAHIAKMCAKTSLLESDLVDYMDSKATMQYFEANKPEEDWQPYSINAKGEKKDFSIYGYIASVVTTKNLGDEVEDSSQSNDEVKVDEIVKTLNISDSNRRISISSKGRAGNLNAKGALRLADKFYTKYLFGNVVAPMFEDPEFGPDMALPNREGYKTTDLRWEYLRAYLKSLGDKAMTFSNEIAKTKRKKAESNNSAFLTERTSELHSKVFNKVIDRELWLLIVRYFSEAARKKIELSPELANKFLIISYKSNKKKKDEVSFKNALVLYEILSEIFDKVSQLKIFFAFDEMTLEPGEKIYPKLKRELWREANDFYKFHMFVLLSDAYVNNWYTDIEYGMAYSQSDWSGDLVPTNITTFIPDQDETLKVRLTPFDPLFYDSMINFNKGQLIRILQKVCASMGINGFDDAIALSVSKHMQS